MPGRRFTDREEEEIVAAYRVVGNMAKLALQFNCSETGVLGVLRRAKVVIRSYAEVRKNPSTRHSYFNTIDTEEKAYILGLLATDGNVCCTPKRKVVKLSLGMEDERHVAAIRDILAPTVSIYLSDPKEFGAAGKYICQGAATLTVSSAEMVCDLSRHGIHPNKTHSVLPWAGGTLALQAAYWRGCVDGDGSVCKSVRAGRTEWMIGFTGNKEMVQGFADFICQNTYSPWAKKNKKPSPSRGSFQVTFAGTYLPRQIVSLLYTDGLTLPRKKMVVNDLLATTSPCPWA